jgi:hypothetical protein
MTQWIMFSVCVFVVVYTWLQYGWQIDGWRDCAILLFCLFCYALRRPRAHHTCEHSLHFNGIFSVLEKQAANAWIDPRTSYLQSSKDRVGTIPRTVSSPIGMWFWVCSIPPLIPHIHTLHALTNTSEYMHSHSSVSVWMHVCLLVTVMFDCDLDMWPKPVT